MDPETGERRAVRVTIYNQSYTLRTSDDPAQVEALAHQVDDLMNEIAAHSGSADAVRAAVLACLHLADQLRTLEASVSGLRQQIGDKHRELHALLDSVIGEP